MATKINFGKKLLLAAFGIAAVAGPAVFGLVNANQVRAQSSVADWQISAGGKMSFDVASVKQNKSGLPPSGDRVTANFPLGPGDSYSPNGGLFSATNSALSSYIGFAYKLTPNQTQSLQSQLPKWANEDRFDIQARAAANATKDQMRLMMQALLADRFGLTVHRKTRQLPVFALVLAKPGKTGPQLRVHPPGAPPCAPLSLTHSTPAPADGLPSACGVFLTQLDGGRTRTIARNVTIGLIASSMTAPGLETMDRPVVDQTGLTGTFDFALEWTPEVPPGPDMQANESGPTFLEALKDQLGLKLDSKTGPVDVLVVDHVEEPSEN